MISGIQVWWWPPKKWAETGHLCNKLRFAGHNFFVHIHRSEHNRDVNIYGNIFQIYFGMSYHVQAPTLYWGGDIFCVIIIIIIIISLMHGIYTYIPDTNCVPRQYSAAAILLLLFMVLIPLVSVLNLLYFYISTFRSMCAVPNMAVSVVPSLHVFPVCYYYYYYCYCNVLYISHFLFLWRCGPKPPHSRGF